MSEENNSSWQTHVLNTSTWIRGGVMLLFALINYITRLLILLLSALQFLIMLVRGQTHEKLLDLGEILSIYSYQIMLFLTFNTDEKPYPFAEWPESEDQVTQAKKTTTEKVAKPQAKDDDTESAL